MLQIVLLDVLGEVVYLHGRQHGAEGEDRGAVAHRGLAVEGALRVHEYDRDLLAVGHGGREYLRPHEDARGVALRAASPREATQGFVLASQPLVRVLLSYVL